MRYARQRMMGGRAAWAVLGALILLYEAFARDGQLLSEICDEWLARYPVTTRVAMAAVALHLANVLPPSVDPLHLSFSAVRKIVAAV